MAPLSQAIAPQRDNSATVDEQSRHVYQGTVDPEWVVGSIPHGGYVLGLIVASCVECQQTTKHKDPIHVTAHFLQPTARSEYRVEIELVRKGSRFSNLKADLVQEGETKVTTHMVFGTLPAFDAPPSNKRFEDIPPCHPLYRPIPLPTHPRSISTQALQHKYGRFRQYIRCAPDPAIAARNRAKLVAPPGMHEGGLESGSWWEMKAEDVRLSSIPFLADVFENTPVMLSEAHGDGPLYMWHPTMVMTLEFKHQLPPSGVPGLSHHTFGVYGRGSFLEHGRHDIYSEIWSAPSDIGQDDGGQAGDESWRRKMRCLAVTSQMALSVPLAINKSKGQKRNAKL